MREHILNLYSEDVCPHWTAYEAPRIAESQKPDAPWWQDAESSTCEMIPIDRARIVMADQPTG